MDSEIPICYFLLYFYIFAFQTSKNLGTVEINLFFFCYFNNLRNGRNDV